MDPVTHTLVGVTTANALFRRRDGAPAVVALALASNMPDVDALVHLSGDPAAILMRRSFGHSLFTFPLWSLALAALLSRIYPGIGLGRLFGLCLLGGALHVFFDLVNSFGVVLLWPFSGWRPELAIVFILDLLLTGLLAAPLLLCLPPSMRPRLEGLSRWALALAGAYVLFCGFNRFLARRSLEAERLRIESRLGIHADFAYVFPEPMGPHRWRGVLRVGETYRLFLIYSLAGRAEPRGEVRTELGDPSVRTARGAELAGRLEWFFKAPVWKVHSPEEVSVYDLRFRSLVLNRGSPFEYRFGVREGEVRGLGWR